MSERNILSAIDIRADKIICLIAQELEIINRGKILQLIGVGISKFPVECTKPLSLPSADVISYIKTAIKDAENEANVIVSDVYISIAENMRSEYVEYQASHEGKVIRDYDIKEFYKSIQFKNLYTKSEEPLHSFPISYRIDNKKSISDPIGMKADNLQIKWHIISVSKNYLELINNLFVNMELNPKQIISSHYSTSLAVLTEEESDLGAVTVEIQKNKTVLSYTFDSQLIGFDIIKIGTFHLANDISQIKSLSMEESEKIRKKIDKVDKQKNQDIEFEKYYEIYYSRAEELANIIFSTASKTRFNSLVSSSIILTGYGAKSIMIQKMLKNKFKNASFRLGSTRKINGSKTYIDNPSLASSFGLLAYVTIHDLEGEIAEQSFKKNTLLSIVYNFFKNL